MIFIAKNHNNLPVSIVSCKNIELARAYMQGKDINYNTLQEFSIEADRDNEALGFVTPLLKTKEVEKYFSSYGHQTNSISIEVIK